ncbi:MAG TPA: hypothetical protein VKS60_17005 [Stellaceae bacterium]|nr:hypothetical protein [Stellaceae bacterium]
MIAGNVRIFRPSEDIGRLRAFREYAVQRCKAAATALDGTVATLKLARDESLLSAMLIDRVKQAADDYAAWYREVEELDRLISAPGGGRR